MWHGVGVLDVFGEEGVDGRGDGGDGEGLQEEGVGTAHITRRHTYRAQDTERGAGQGRGGGKRGGEFRQRLWEEVGNDNAKVRLNVM